MCTPTPRWTPGAALRTAAILGAYLVASVVYTFPLVLHLSDALIDRPDTLFNSWVLAWDVHALTTNPLHLLAANIFFPFPQPLTYSDTMLTGALMVAPIELLTANPALAHNLLTLASLVLAAFATYLLVHELCRDRPAAFVCGALFSFSLIRQGQLDTVQLLQIGWLPLALLFLHRALRSGRTADYLLFALLSVCQALAAVYLMFLTAVGIGTFLVFEVITSRTLLRRGHAIRLGGALVVIAVCLSPVALAYGATQRIFGYHWSPDLIHSLSAAPTDFLAVQPSSLAYAWLLARFDNPIFTNGHALFPGLLVLLFAAVSLLHLAPWLRARAARREVGRYVLIGSVAVALALGPSAAITGMLPYDWFYKWVPGFSAMRIPARFDVLGLLALAVLAGFGMALLSDWVLRRGGTPGPVLGAIGALAFVELLSSPVALRPVPSAPNDGVYAWLRSHEPDAVVGEIPTRGPTGLATIDYQYLSTLHWHPLVNGYSGFTPPQYVAVSDQLNAFPDPTAVEVLRGLGVRYVVAHLESLDAANRQRLANADLSSPGFSMAATFGSVVVYELAPLTNPSAWQAHAQLEVPARVARGQPVSVTLSIVNDTSQAMVLPTPGTVSVQVQWDGVTTSGEPGLDDRLFLAPGDHAVLHFPAGVPPSLASATAATVHVRLTGALQTEVVQSVEFADLPTSTQATGLSGTLERVQVPPFVHAGAQVPIDVIARNSGQSVWLPVQPADPAAPGRIGVSVRNWISPDATPLPPVNYSTVHLDWTVNPGQPAAFMIHTQAPPTPGHYQLVLDMVSENVTWFSDVNGGTKTLVPIDVMP